MKEQSLTRRQTITMVVSETEDHPPSGVLCQFPNSPGRQHKQEVPHLTQAHLRHFAVSLHQQYRCGRKGATIRRQTSMPFFANTQTHANAIKRMQICACICCVGDTYISTHSNIVRLISNSQDVLYIQVFVFIFLNHL